MKYKLVGIRPNHKQMKSMVGTTLYSYYITAVESERVNVAVLKNTIVGIRINEETDKWEFILDNENLFCPDEPLFVNEKSLKRYVKQVWKGRTVYRGFEVWN